MRPIGQCSRPAPCWARRSRSPALSALTGEPAAELEPRLRALARREIVALDTDPQSPERGQWGFTQALIREVAYSTLSKKRSPGTPPRGGAVLRVARGRGGQRRCWRRITSTPTSRRPRGPRRTPWRRRRAWRFAPRRERAAALGSHEQAIGISAARARSRAEPGGRGATAGGDRATRSSRRRPRRRRGDRRAGRPRRTTEVGDEVGELRAIAGEARGIDFPVRARGAAIEILVPAVERARTGGRRLDQLAAGGAGGARLRLHRGARQCASNGPIGRWSRAERLGDLPVIADVLVTKGIVAGDRGTRPGRRRPDGGRVCALAEANDLSAGPRSVPGSTWPRCCRWSIRGSALERARGGDRRRSPRGVARHNGDRRREHRRVRALRGRPDWAEAAVDELSPATPASTRRRGWRCSARRSPAAHCAGSRSRIELDELRALRDATGGTVSTVRLGVVARGSISGGPARGGGGEVARGGAAELVERATDALWGARSAVLARDAAAARELLGLLAETGVRGPALDVEREVLAAALVALEGHWPRPGRVRPGDPPAGGTRRSTSTSGSHG